VDDFAKAYKVARDATLANLDISLGEAISILETIKAEAVFAVQTRIDQLSNRNQTEN
jgi:hypothetical protein